MQFSVLRAEMYQLRNENCQCLNESSCLGSRANTFLLKYLREVFLCVCVCVYYLTCLHQICIVTSLLLTSSFARALTVSGPLMQLVKRPWLWLFLFSSPSPSPPQWQERLKRCCMCWSQSGLSKVIWEACKAGSRKNQQIKENSSKKWGSG